MRARCGPRLELDRCQARPLAATTLGATPGPTTRTRTKSHHRSAPRHALEAAHQCRCRGRRPAPAGCCCSRRSRCACRGVAESAWWPSRISGRSSTRRSSASSTQSDADVLGSLSMPGSAMKATCRPARRRCRRPPAPARQVAVADVQRDHAAGRQALAVQLTASRVNRCTGIESPGERVHHQHVEAARGGALQQQAVSPTATSTVAGESAMKLEVGVRRAHHGVVDLVEAVAVAGGLAVGGDGARAQGPPRRRRWADRQATAAARPTPSRRRSSGRPPHPVGAPGTAGRA